MSVGFRVSLNGRPAESLPVLSIAYNHPVLLEAGTATVLVPRDSPAYSPAHIDERRGFPVTIDSKLGRWPGIALVSERTPEGWLLECSHVARLLGTKLTLERRTYPGPWLAGDILTDVLNITFGGLASPRLLPGVMAIPNGYLTDYDVAGRYVSDVVIDLMDQTGLEWRLRDEYLDLVPPAAPVYAPLLCEGNRALEVHRRIDHNDQVYAVHSRAEAGSLIASSPAGIGIWSQEIVLDSSLTDITARVLEAAHALVAPRLPEVSITLALPETRPISTWETVREGMTLRVLAPSTGFVDQINRVRVLRRRYQEGSAVLDLEGQFLFWPDQLGLAGVGQELPPVPRDRPNTTQFEERIKRVMLFPAPPFFE